MAELNRREMVFGAGGMLIAAGCAQTVTALPDVSGISGNASLSINTPEENLRSLVRMTASLDPVDTPWWYNGTMYAIVGEEQPRPIMKFEGMEIYWMRKISASEYELTGNTVTFFRDINTHAFLESWENPYTGKTVEVSDAVQGGGKGRGFSYATNGIRPMMFKDKIPAGPLQMEWSYARDTLWMHNQTVYPPGMPPPRAQRQTMFAPIKDYLDDSVRSLPSVFSSTVFMPWLKWMDMGDRPGHVVWHASGAKLRSLDDLPAEYRARAEAEYGDRMTANPEL